jgi:hypothetical protein
MSIVFFKMEQSNWKWKSCVENSQHRKTIDNVCMKTHRLNTQLSNN